MRLPLGLPPTRRRDWPAQTPNLVQIDSPNARALGWAETALDAHLAAEAATDKAQSAAEDATRAAEYSRLLDVARKALASGGWPADILGPAVPAGADWLVILAVVQAVEDRAWARGFEAARLPYELPF